MYLDQGKEGQTDWDKEGQKSLEVNLDVILLYIIKL